MTQKLRITVISKDRDFSSQIGLWLQGKGLQSILLHELGSVLGIIYVDPPDVVIADLRHGDSETQNLIRDLRGDSYFSMLPVIGIFEENAEETFDWSGCPLDDFIAYPFNHAEFFSRINLSLQRIGRVLDNNPLTKLPGNTSIQNAIEKALGRDLAVCYIDINNFKPYNDTYGFSHGDEVLRMVARIMANSVREAGSGGFCGHIGGDDFVFIVNVEKAESVCQMIIDHFRIIVSDLFGEEEKTRGFYRAKDRLGNEQEIPLLGIAIAVVPMNTPKMTHFGKVAEVSAEMKKYAKKSGESCYVVDRRRT
ncbi:MAG: diguanylate cyclase [Nitrospirae bacterium]|nr:diguanylate cyclase [Nitrospirota bacterium]